MVFDMTSFEGFVEQLVEQTRLTERQAQVYTLRKCNHSRGDIAESLGISKGAVDSHYSSAHDVVSMQLFGQELHFYQSEVGRVPLEWQSWFTACKTSYVLSSPRTDLVASDVVTLEDDVLFLTVYQGERIEKDYVLQDGAAQHIPLNDASVKELGQALQLLFSEQLGKYEAIVFELAYDALVSDDVSRRDWYCEVFGNRQFEFSDMFLAEVDSETRFIAFSESDSLSQHRERVLLGQSIETGRSVSLADFEFDSWLSIVGKIGSGKSFTLDLVLSQIARDKAVSIVEFNPFVEERESAGEYETHPQEEAGELTDDVIDAWFDSVFEYAKMDVEIVYAVADEAHYLLQKRPERFTELVELATSREDVRLITATQTFVEFVEAAGDETEMLTSGSWVFHRMDAIKRESPVTVPDCVNQLDVGGRGRSAEAILVDGESTQGFEFTVSLEGHST